MVPIGAQGSPRWPRINKLIPAHLVLPWFFSDPRVRKAFTSNNNFWDTRRLALPMDINELTYTINGAVFEVNRVLGPGFLEKVYPVI